MAGWRENVSLLEEFVKSACLGLTPADVLLTPIYGASPLPHGDTFTIVGGSSNGDLNTV